MNLFPNHPLVRRGGVTSAVYFPTLIRSRKYMSPTAVSMYENLRQQAAHNADT